MAYYRLKDDFILRGWDKLPYAAVNVRTFNPEFMDRRKSNALKLCTGTIDTSLAFIPEDCRLAIQELLNDGIIEECQKGHGLSEQQQYRKFPVRFVHQVHWSITGKCNYKCRHCYLSAPEAKYGELSRDTIMSIIPQLKECDIMRVSLTGGEPLVRPDFLEIVDSLIEHGIHITQIYSNGALVNEELLRELDRRKIHPAFVMSYDGEGWHDWLRGIPGAEEIVNKAFALCRDKGFPTSAEMCLHKHNIHTIRASVNHLASLGVGSLKIASVSDSGDWTTNGESESTPSLDETFRAFEKYIPEYYADNMPLEINLSLAFTASPDKPEMFMIPGWAEKVDCDACICGCARNVIYISPEGRVMPCMPMAGTKIQDKMPLIQEEGLAHCINDSFWFELVNIRRRDFFAVHPECKSCSAFGHCDGGCRADALMYDSENYMGMSEMTCEFLRGGWPQRIASAVHSVRPDAEGNF